MQAAWLAFRAITSTLALFNVALSQGLSLLPEVADSSYSTGFNSLRSGVLAQIKNDLRGYSNGWKVMVPGDVSFLI